MQDFPPFRLDTINQCLWRLQETAQDELLEAVWPETHVQPEVLKSRIFEVRSALGDRPKTPRFIETLPRRGYRFIAVVHESPAAASVLPAPQRTAIWWDARAC
jgi:DNA-binding winged helix-turn-helix (wHTH) protein